MSALIWDSSCLDPFTQAANQPGDEARWNQIAITNGLPSKKVKCAALPSSHSSR